MGLRSDATPVSHPTGRPEQIFLLRTSGIYRTDARGRRPELLVSGEFSSFAAYGHKLACLGDDGIFIAKPPTWTPARVIPDRNFYGSLFWLSATQLLCQRRSPTRGGDDGLWLLDTTTHALHRISAGFHTLYEVYGRFVRSPGGDLIAFGGTLQDGPPLDLGLRVIDTATLKVLNLPGNGRFPNTMGFAWLDKQHLLMGTAHIPVAKPTLRRDPGTRLAHR